MNIIKKKLLSALEKNLAKEATVLDIRYWYQKELVEIDLHVPDLRPQEWQSAPRMKIRVAPGVYRDYSPTMWDEETCTCSLIINVAHGGIGAQWALGLQKGDLLLYLGIASTAHKTPAPGLICIGDESSLAHFLAIQQLMGISSAALTGAICFTKPQHVQEYREYIQSPLVPLYLKKKDDIDTLREYLDQLKPKQHTIYLAGGSRLVVEAKKHLRNSSQFQGSIKSQGFWK